MAERVVYPQWRNETQRTNYPFADWCVVPSGLNEVFVDASLFFPADGPAYLSRISVSEEQVLVVVTQGGETATGQATRGSSAGSIVLRSPAGFSRGVLVGNTASLFLLPTGDTAYTQAQTEFVARVTAPLPRDGVTSLSGLVGEVSLVAENGVRFTPGVGGVGVEAVGVLPAATPGTVGAAEGIRTINMVSPNGAGVFRMVSCVLTQEAATDSALRISAGEHSLTFSLAGVT